MLRPLNDQIILRPEMSNEKSSGGIYFTDRHRDVEWKIKRIGTIIALGPGRTLKDGSRSPIPLSVGDKVYFQPMAQAVEVEGEMLVFAKEEHILAKIEEI